MVFGPPSFSIWLLRSFLWPPGTGVWYFWFSWWMLWFADLFIFSVLIVLKYGYTTIYYVAIHYRGLYNSTVLSPIPYYNKIIFTHHKLLTLYPADWIYTTERKNLNFILTTITTAHITGIYYNDRFIKKYSGQIQNACLCLGFCTLHCMVTLLDIKKKFLVFLYLALTDKLIPTCRTVQ